MPGEINFNEIMNNEAFQKLEPEKLLAIKDIAGKIQGKSVPEALGILNSYQSILNSGKPITKQEQDIMIAVILNSMDEESRGKFMSAMRMVSMMKGGN